MRHRTPHLLLLASLLAACSSDGFTSEDSGTDASQDTATTSDVGTNDGGPSDAASDATSDAPTSTFCDTQTGFVFCEDFDKGSFTTGWMADPGNTQAPPTLALTPTKSGSGSLKMVSSGVDAGAPVFARYIRAVTPPSVVKSTLEADIFVANVSVPALNVVVPLAFGLKEGAPGIPVAFGLTTTGWTCFGPSGATKDQAGVVPINTWHHVKLEAFWLGGNGFDIACTLDSVTLTLAGVNASGHTGDRRLVLGHNTSSTVGPTEIYLDNFIFRTQ